MADLSQEMVCEWTVDCRKEVHIELPRMGCLTLSTRQRGRNHCELKWELHSTLSFPVTGPPDPGKVSEGVFEGVSEGFLKGFRSVLEGVLG